MSAYSAPVKAIHSEQDFEQFKKSAALTSILDFVKNCAEGAVGTPNSATLTEPVAVILFSAFMDKLSALVDEIPPIKQPMRFGNKAFRDWHSQMLTKCEHFLISVLVPVEKSEAIVELTPYLGDLFGNPTRIDYGTGHELNFAIFFLLLTKLGAIPDTKEARTAVVTKAFVSYIRLMRKLQTVYMLEPAGSHGVWGLDDYHCLVFLWGSAQLSLQKEIQPSDIHNAEVLREESREYLYLEGISFIKQIKSSAPFAETSPMLNDISALRDWGKICSGLMRLFQGEVLGKFPVIQHVLFGSLLPCTWEHASPHCDHHSDHHAHPVHHHEEGHIIGERLHTVPSTHTGLTAVVPEGPSGRHVELARVPSHAGMVSQCVLERPKVQDVDPSVVPLEIVEALHVPE